VYHHHHQGKELESEEHETNIHCIGLIKVNFNNILLWFNLQHLHQTLHDMFWMKISKTFPNRLSKNGNGSAFLLNMLMLAKVTAQSNTCSQ
jgi:uncharacterized UPF0160 family protein